MDKYLIQIKGVEKQFKKNIILEDINLKIKENEIFCIIGINGSGKTTLLKTMIGFYKPEKGTIYYNNKDIFKNMRKIKNEWGFSAQEHSFYPKLTVRENLQYFGSLYGIKKAVVNKNVTDVLKFIKLAEYDHVIAENLSVGMKRRLDIGCAIIHNPKVLILDESTEDLDVILRKEIISLIQTIHKKGTTIILTSHMLDEIEQIATYIAVIHDRHIIKTGTVEELKNSTKSSSLTEAFEKITKNA